MLIKNKKEELAALGALATQEMEVKQAIRAYRGRKTILCACLKKHPIHNITLIQDYAWSEGGAYEDGEWYSHTLYIVCPNNPNQVSRLYWPSYYKVDYPLRGQLKWNAEMQFKRLYKDSFKEVVRTENQPLRAVSNHYIDDNLHKYDITLGE